MRLGKGNRRSCSHSKKSESVNQLDHPLPLVRLLLKCLSASNLLGQERNVLCAISNHDNYSLHKTEKEGGL